MHARALDQSGQTVYYGPPYVMHGYGYLPDSPYDSISAAVTAWWADYQQAWPGAFPGCFYTFQLTDPNTTNNLAGNYGEIAEMPLYGRCGGWGQITGTTYPYDPHKNGGAPGGCCGAGDPINLGTGNEFEDQEDYSVSGLQFHRYYNSDPSVASSHLGAHWRHSFDRSLEYLTDGTNFSATLYRLDGKQVLFQKLNGVWTADPDIADTLVETDNAQGQPTGWTYFVAATQQFESYDANGLLVSIEELSGQITTLAYSTASTPPSIAPVPGLLITVTDPRGRQLNFVYDTNSRVTQVTLPDGATLGYSYDTANNLNQVTYPGGAIRAYKYDESGHVGVDLPNALTGIVDENGKRYADISYDAQGRAISSQLGGTAALTQVTYNSDGTTTVTYPLGVQSTFGFAVPYGKIDVGSVSQPCAPSCIQNAAARTYDANGYPASATDFNGVATAHTYDAVGLETQRIEGQGTPVQRTISTQWDIVLRNPLDRTILDANGTLTAKTDWVYNARGQVLTRCEDDPTVAGATSYVCTSSGIPPAGIRRWKYTYCDTVGGNCPLIGLLLSVTGPRTDLTQTTTYSYYTTRSATGCGTPGAACHQAGDLYQVTDALGHVTTYASYDGAGRPTRITDANGVNTDMTYTPRGWLHTRSVAGTVTTIDYDAVGNVVKVTQPDGVFTSYGYDDAHRLNKITDALGNHIDYTLDAAGNRTAENTYASGNPTPTRTLSRQYNTLGQLVKDLDAYNHATTYGYDPNGNRTDATDALNVATHSSYDALNRLSQTIQNYQGTGTTANTTTAYGYDSHDNLTQVTDPDTLSTQYQYSGLNDLGQLRSPDTGTSNYTYDAAGNRASQTDARGIVTSYTYDALNRLTSISYPTSALNVHYYYDEANSITGCSSSYPIGRMTRMTDSSGSTTYCYDARGNVISKQVTIAGQPGTTTYAYNTADRLTSVTYPFSGPVISYTRDTNGRIATIKKSTTSIITAIGYLPFGPATSYTFASGGQTLTKTYDANYRPTDIAGSALNLHFVLDAVGDITAEGDAPGVHTPNESYQYDPLYRLQQVTEFHKQHTGAPVAPWQSYSYDATGDRLSKITAGQTPPDSYSYTPGTHHLIGISGYDASSRSMDANGNTTALQANGWMYGLGYDNTNRLTLVQQNGATIASYSLNGKGERVYKAPVAQYGSPTRFVFDEAGKLLFENGAATRAYVWADDTLVATVENRFTINYVHTDHLGTPRAVTATTGGAPIWTWPWTQNPFGEQPASGNNYTLNLRYPGQYYDAETGLIYNGRRDYEPGTGRYAEADPLGLMGGINPYAYVGGNPVNLIDPLGLAALTACEKSKLAPYIPKVDLDNADLHNDKEVPWLLPGYGGITIGNDIYFQPGQMDPSTPAGIASLGHELVHVGQYRGGATVLSFLWQGILGGGHDGSALEKPAIALEATVRKDLSSSGSGGCGCNP